MRRWRVESIRRVHQLQVAQPDQGRLILTEHHPAGVFRRPEFNLFLARALRYRIFGVLGVNRCNCLGLADRNRIKG
jgi:hypothetical protein